jgi:hypothetical protein
MSDYITSVYPGPTAENLAAIPAALKSLTQWVLWRAEWRPTPPVPGQKVTKIPIDPQTLLNADVTDPLTWGRFQDCVAALPVALEEWQGETTRPYLGGGVGFVLTADDPYFGVDLDGCVDPVTGSVEAWAREIVDSLNTYTEISQSGTGLHLLGEGDLPPRGRKKGTIEMYTAWRFFTVTGWRLQEMPATIEPRQIPLGNLWCRLFAPTVGDAVWTLRKDGVIANTQPGVITPWVITAINPAPTGELFAMFNEMPGGWPLIDCELARNAAPDSPAVSFDDAAIVTHMKSATNADKVTALGLGDWAKDYHSQSEADLAFCCHLAFWTRDADQIDRLFRTTGLLRPKWDERRGSQTYGQRTIAEALARQPEHYEPPPTLLVGRNGAAPAYIWGTSSTNGAAPSSTAVWEKATPVGDFLRRQFAPQKPYVRDLIFPGAITIVAAPRGSYKTITALALAIALASGGTFRAEQVPKLSVLLLDRDNPPSIVQQLLRNLGAVDGHTLDIMTRDEAPPLTQKGAWQHFPSGKYDLVVIDSLGSATEGISEKEGKETQHYLATLKNLAYNGPAVLALDNTNRSGLAYRGRGEKADAIEVLYEARNITGWVPPTDAEWWEHLPDYGDNAWQQSATRRMNQQVLRIAFTPTKFRLGIFPAAFALEIDTRNTPWLLQDITATLGTAGQDAATESRRKAQHQVSEAEKRLVFELQKHSAHSPMLKTDALRFLERTGLTRKVASTLLEQGGNRDVSPGGPWLIRPIPSHPSGKAMGVYLPEWVSSAKGLIDLGDPQKYTPKGQPPFADKHPPNGKRSALFSDRIQAAVEGADLLPKPGYTTAKGGKPFSEETSGSQDGV